MIKGIVIAGNYKEYMDYVYMVDIDPKEYIYTYRIEQIQGLHNIHILYTGKWWKNPLIMSGELQHRFNEIHYSGVSRRRRIMKFITIFTIGLIILIGICGGQW